MAQSYSCCHTQTVTEQTLITPGPGHSVSLAPHSLEWVVNLLRQSNDVSMHMQIRRALTRNEASSPQYILLSVRNLVFVSTSRTALSLWTLHFKSYHIIYFENFNTKLQLWLFSIWPRYLLTVSPHYSPPPIPICWSELQLCVIHWTLWSGMCTNVQSW